MKKFIVTIIVLTCMTLAPMVVNAKSNSSNLNRERLEVGRALLEVTALNVASILPHYTDDIEYHDPIVDVYGIEEMTDFLFLLFGSTPDLVTTVEEEIAIDDTYTATWEMEGVFAGVPYVAKGMSLIKFREKSTDVYYQRDYYTEGDIMVSIPPLTPVVTGFRNFYLCAVDPEAVDPDFECPQSPAPTSP